MISNRFVLKAAYASLLALKVSCQISLNTIPTDACIGHPDGTGTVNSATSVATGQTVYITPGPAWKQGGATWEWILGAKDVVWYYVTIPGAGGIFGEFFGDNGVPDTINEAFRLSQDNRTISFSVAPSLDTGKTVMAWITSAPGQAKFANSTKPTLVPGIGVNFTKPTLVSGAAANSPKPTLVSGTGANFTRPTLVSRTGDGKVAVTLKGATRCAGPTTTSSTGPTDAAIASSCSNNKITPGTAAFSTYKVSSYMSSLLATALPVHGGAGASTLDAASAIKSDVGPPGPKCTYIKQCDNIDCSDVKDYNDGTILSVQRFIAYQTVVNFNNYLYSLYQALNDAGEVAGLMSADIVETFFVNPKPDATYKQIIGIVAPWLGFIQSALGPISVAASTALGVANSLAQGIGSIAQSAVADERFDEFSSISSFLGQYLQNASEVIEHAYNKDLGPETTPGTWVGSKLDHSTGLFGDGTFSDSDFAQSLTKDAQTSMAKVFAYKSINFALKDSGNFIMFVPYGVPIKSTKGKMIKQGIDEQFCREKLRDTDEMDSITICDAPGGMARVFNAGSGKGSAGDASKLLKSYPQGWDSNLQIVPGESFSMGSAVKGSIASWRAGDFDYDASDPFEDSILNGKDLDIGALQKLKISQETAGFFSIPVCQVRDLRAYPPASGKGCTACDTAAAIGGTSGSKEKFWDHITKDVQIIINSDPNGEQCGGDGGYCSNTVCDFDPFTG
ncbi:MAG: hypothetical protein OHK93_001938 [Ramalina farinacea]|uniref:Uncharacterized protein n=1 Tax=Ramalina farinacea TaxID=258253 RepID=A0AA43QS63_9LECA|nr:hypothetical protein [Ramalina farinacea]